MVTYGDDLKARADVFAKIDAAQLTAAGVATVGMIVTGMFYLKELSEELGIPMDDITFDHVITDAAKTFSAVPK